MTPDEPGSSDVGGTGLVRVRLDLAYDGGGFSGWAAQPGLRTVEAELTGTLSRLLPSAEPLRVTVAGRTDAGVHARGQVAHVDVPEATWRALPGRSSLAPPDSLLRRLAGLLPHDVVVRSVSEAPVGFDARFSAVWRRYRYCLADADSPRDPLHRGHVLWLKPGRRLDVDAMADAVAPLVGEHDFLPFCRPREGATTIRTLQVLRWSRDESGLVVADVRADAFCHHMVRALVGVSVAVGDGTRRPGWPAAVLEAGVRNSAVPVAPPRGLTLEEVGYPADGALAERARQARTRRA